MDKSLPSIIRKIEENTRNNNNNVIDVPYNSKTPILPKGYELKERDVIVFAYHSETKTAYGYDNDNIYKSTDDWETRESIFQPPSTEEFRMRGYGVGGRLLDDGSLLIATVTYPRGSNYGYLYKSNKDRTSFTKVLNLKGGIPTLAWGLKDYGNMIFVGEYGQIGRQVFMSVDYGATWKTIYDRPLDDINEEQQCHVHDVAYDIYRGIVWVSFGDGNNRKLIYSHNFGNEWHSLYSGIPPIDPIGILASPTHVMFGSDTTPNGIDALPYPDVTPKILSPVGLTRRWHGDKDDNQITLVSNAIEIDGVYYYATTFSTARDIAYILCSPDGWNFYEMVKISLEAVDGPSGIMNLYDDGKGHLRAAVKTEYEGGYKELIVKKPTFKNI